MHSGLDSKDSTLGSPTRTVGFTSLMGSGLSTPCRDQSFGVPNSLETGPVPCTYSTYVLPIRVETPPETLL